MWVNMRAYNFFVSERQFTNFSLNVGGAVVDHLFFRLLISQFVEEILASLAIKVESYPKSRVRNFGRFLPSQILGLRPLTPKSCTYLAARHVEKFSPKVIKAHALKFGRFF